MIKKSLISGLIISIVYSVVIELNPELSFHPHLWQGNLVKAQKYIYDDDNTSKENILVGSSLSNRIVMDSLPGFYNLAFPGQSSYDGLRIIKNMNILPKNIYIETNFALREENEKFINSLFHPVFFYSAKYIPIMRIQKQPIGVFIEELYKFLDIKSDDIEKPVNEDLFQQLFQDQEKEFSWDPGETRIKKQTDLMAEFVDYFEKNGVKIYFYEVPINYKLVQYTYPSIARNSMKEKFPPERYHYLPSDTSKYKTTDGLHFNKQEAARYTHFFKTHIPH